MPFTDAAWDGPKVRSTLNETEWCKVCLVDTNASGEPKVKYNCKLPVRATPGGPYNKMAIRNAMGRIQQLKGVPDEKKRAAARKLARLAAEAEIEITSPEFRRLAGLKER